MKKILFYLEIALIIFLTLVEIGLILNVLGFSNVFTDISLKAMIWPLLIRCSVTIIWISLIGYYLVLLLVPILNLIINRRKYFKADLALISLTILNILTFFLSITQLARLG